MSGASTSPDAADLIAAAVRLQRQGRFSEAVRVSERLVALSPVDPARWILLSGALLADRRPQAALEASDAGLVRAPGSPGLLCAKANALRSLSRVAESRAAFAAALAIDPTLPEAQFGLALHAIEAGDWEAAAQAAASLLARPDGGPQVDWLSARIALGRRDYANTVTHAERALGAPGLAPEQQAELALLCGQALDALGRSKDAFRAFSRGKGMLRALYAERAASRESELDRLNRLAAWFRAADRRLWREPPPKVEADPVRGHVFLVGFPRSGTTLLEQALAGHPDLSTLEEAPTFAEAYDAFLATPDGLERLARLSEAGARHWRSVYWRVVAEHGAAPAGKVFVDKAPAGTFSLPLVAKLFPDAKVLFAVRDPRDVALSCFTNHFQMNALTYAFTDLAETARCYAAAMELAGVYREVLPIQPLDVRYERLVDDFAGELGRITDFLGIEVTPAMLDVAATAGRRIVRTPSAAQVRAGLNRQGLARWRAYAAELAPAMPILAPWVERLGYGEG